MILVPVWLELKEVTFNLASGDWAPHFPVRGQEKLRLVPIASSVRVAVPGLLSIVNCLKCAFLYLCSSWNHLVFYSDDDKECLARTLKAEGVATPPGSFFIGSDYLNGAQIGQQGNLSQRHRMDTFIIQPHVADTSRRREKKETKATRARKVAGWAHGSYNSTKLINERKRPKKHKKIRKSKQKIQTSVVKGSLPESICKT